ncbi:MAG: hypothetical protein AABZ32_05850 [Bacteroidota bacterium]
MSTYRIKIAKDGFEFEAEGDKKFVLEMLNKYGKGTTNQDESYRKKTHTEKDTEESKTKSLSHGEFIRKAVFKKDVDIVLAFGYYMEEYSGVPSFTSSDINKCYYEARIEPSNTSQYMTYLINKVYIMRSKKKEDTGRTKYVLTRTGKEYIEKKLSQNANDKEK